MSDTPIKWDKVSVRVDKWKRLQSLCEELEPHEHYEGMNECNICDEPLTDVLIRHCEKLLTLERDLARVTAERDAWKLRALEAEYTLATEGFGDETQTKADLDAALAAEGKPK